MQNTPGVHVQAKTPRFGAAWKVLTAVLAIEVLGGLAVLIPATGEFFAANEDPLGQRVSVFLALVIAWLWVVITLFGVVRLRAGWARGSALTIHVLMFAAGTGILQGIYDAPTLGWILVVLAFVGFFSALLARALSAGETDSSPSEE